MNQNVVCVLGTGNVSHEVCKEASITRRVVRTNCILIPLSPGDTCRRCIASRVNASVIRAQNKRYHHRPAQELVEETFSFHRLAQRNQERALRINSVFPPIEKR